MLSSTTLMGRLVGAQKLICSEAKVIRTVCVKHSLGDAETRLAMPAFAAVTVGTTVPARVPESASKARTPKVENAIPKSMLPDRILRMGWLNFA